MFYRKVKANPLASMCLLEYSADHGENTIVSIIIQVDLTQRSRLTETSLLIFLKHSHLAGHRGLNRYN